MFMLLKENMKFSIYCLDENNIPNINPTQFSFISKNDRPPNIIIKEPSNESEIDETFSIPLSFNIIDDIGISKVWIEYSVFNPDFPNINSKINEELIYSENQNTKNNLLINDNWDISQMNLLMGDELHFYVLAKDNNINENNVAKSQKLIAKFPSIEDIFSEIEKYLVDGGVLKAMLYAKNSWKNYMIEVGLDHPESQFGVPIANTYSKNEIICKIFIEGTERTRDSSTFR